MSNSEYQRRFDYRRQMLDLFYKDVDYIYRELKNVPDNDENEGAQKDFITRELRNLQNKIDRFIIDMYN